MTREERNRIQFRLPPDEEDAAVKACTSCNSCPELVQTCLVQKPSSLTANEVKILAIGIQPELPRAGRTSFRIFQDQQSEEVQKLIHQAWSNAYDDDERTVSIECRSERRKRRDVHRAEDAEARANMTLEERQAWVQARKVANAKKYAPNKDTVQKWTAEAIHKFAWKNELPSQTEVGAWGFVCFRLGYTDGDTWQSFKQQLEHRVKKELQKYLIPEHMCAIFQLFYIEDVEPLRYGPGVDTTYLARYFNEFKLSAAMPRGIDTDFFLSAILSVMLNMIVDNVDPVLVIHDSAVTEKPTDYGVFPGYTGTTVVLLCLLIIVNIVENKNHLQQSFHYRDC